MLRGRCTEPSIWLSKPVAKKSSRRRAGFPVARAFVRFVALNNLRAELAEFKIERDRLMSSIIGLPERCSMRSTFPAWQRDTEGQTHLGQSGLWRCGRGDVARSTRSMKGGNSWTTVAREHIRVAATLRITLPRQDIRRSSAGIGTFFDVVDVKSCQAVRRESRSTFLKPASVRAELEADAEEPRRDARPPGDACRDLRRRAPAAVLQPGLRRSSGNSTPALPRFQAGQQPSCSEQIAQPQGKLPEQLSWRSWKETRHLSVYRALPTRRRTSGTCRTARRCGCSRPPIRRAAQPGCSRTLTEQVALETRYNTLVQVQGETIDHLSEGVAVFGAGRAHPPVRTRPSGRSGALPKPRNPSRARISSAVGEPPARRPTTGRTAGEPLAASC